MIVFKLIDPVFKTEPLFIVGCPSARLDKYLQRRFNVTAGDTSDDDIGTMLTWNREPWRVVWVKEWKDDTESLGVLVHEVFHLVTRICHDRGIPIRSHISTGECGDEPAAYMLEHFMKRAMERLRRKEVMRVAKSKPKPAPMPKAPVKGKGKKC